MSENAFPGASSPRTGDEDREPWQVIHSLMEAACRHLDMDVSFLGEFVGDREVFQWVVGDGTSFGLSEGADASRIGAYCQLLIEGGIEPVIADTSVDPAVSSLDVTITSQIGKYIGVPVHRPDGRIYGALCAVGHRPDSTLQATDSRLLEFVAELVEKQLAREEEETKHRDGVKAMLAPVLDGIGLTIAFQPIFYLPCSTIAGYEALARFSAEPKRTPDLWFADAVEVGLGVELELVAFRAALSALDWLPEGAYLSINLSPETACSAAFTDVITDVDCSRIVLEITEHAVVDSYLALSSALAPWRARGVRVAVDDAGAGAANLHHILELAPDHIKMDISLTRDIDTSPAKAALATALVSFGDATGSAILAEGIETVAELETVNRLGVTLGQGYLLGRPGPPPAPSGLQARRRMVGALAN